MIFETVQRSAVASVYDRRKLLVMSSPLGTAGRISAAVLPELGWLAQKRNRFSASSEVTR
jgi:hypothetical protein